MATGIIRRHSRNCPALGTGRCNCNAGWEASVHSVRDDKKIRKRFRTQAEAKSWRAAAQQAVEGGTLRAPTATTLNEAAEAWLAGAEAGEIRNRSGQPYKPATLRGYRQGLDKVLPLFGTPKLSAVTTADLQAVVDRWQGEGQPASTIRNSIKPLQAIYRRAKARDGLPVNPTHGLELPAPRAEEVEIVPPYAAACLLDDLPDGDRGVWATALYAGLRYGELRALRESALDFAAGTIAVRKSWDPVAGEIDPKTRTSRRVTPMTGLLRDLLLEHRLRRGETATDGLVFGEDGLPFQAANLYRRADRAWAVAAVRRACDSYPDVAGTALVRALYAEGHAPKAISAALGVEATAVRAAVAGQPEPKERKADRLRLHQARHTYASMMIAAGVNAKAVQKFMGHSSINVTFDLYGHLMPGTEAETAALLGTYVDAQIRAGEEAARDGSSLDTSVI